MTDDDHHRRVPLGLAVLLTAALVGCVPHPGPEESPTPAATAAPSAADHARFHIECVASDGRVLGTFTRLEEAWASTNYVRIEDCTASAASPEDLELTSEEQHIAETAAADLPGEDPVDLFLWTLATCVRVPSTGSEGMTGLPTSLLRAAGELCPDAPQSRLIEDELETR